MRAPVASHFVGLILCVSAGAACAGPAAVPSTPSPANAGAAAGTSVATVVASPRRAREAQRFGTAAEAQRVVAYPIPVPTFVPGGFRLSSVFVSDHADGGQQVTQLYTLPNPQPRSPELVISSVDAGRPLAVPAGAREPRSIQVRGRTGYSWYLPSASYGYSELVWQEGPLTISVRLGGSWPGPPGDPHARNLLAVQIAESLRPAAPGPL